MEVFNTTLDNGTYTTKVDSSYNISVWKTNVTYINYYTSSNIELGTQEYPYRFLDNAIYDAYNYPNTFQFTFNIQIVGSYSFDINFPILIKSSQLIFQSFGSSSKISINLYPSTMKSKGFSTIGQNFRIRGPEAYQTSNFEVISLYVNLHNSTVEMNNINIVTGSTSMDTLSELIY